MLGVLLALGMALSWAGTGILLRLLPSDMDVFVINTLRAIYGTVAAGLFVLLSGSLSQYRLLTTTQVLYLVGSILVGGLVADVFYLVSLRILGMSRGFPIINSYPLFTVLYSVLFLDEHIGWPVIAGAVLVLLGVYLVARPSGPAAQEQDRHAGQGRLLRGVLLALAAAACFGLEGVLVYLGAGQVNGIVGNSVRVPVVVIACLPIVACRGTWSKMWNLDKRTLVVLIASAVLGWGINGALGVAAVQTIGPSRTGIIGAASPLFAVPMSMAFLGEKPTRYTLLGTLLTVVGIILVL